ncbi:MAG: hypothetical protein ACE5Q6_23130 [Dehalococcoidia bacterium]
MNNFLMAAAEGFISGGVDPRITNLVPSDIEIRINHFFKPLRWNPSHPSFDGSNWSVKNILEIKNGQRILIEGNVFENVWTADQTGRAIVLKSSNTGGRCFWCVCADVTFRLNLVKNASGGFSINLGANNPVPPRNISIRDNVWDNIDASEFGSGARYFVQISAGSNFEINHNTALVTAGRFVIDALGSATGLVFKNNLLPHSSLGVKGPGLTLGTPTLNAKYPGHIFIKNVMWDPPGGVTGANYPADNFLPSLATVQFVNFNSGQNGDYHLQPSSPFKNGGEDGKDIGADIDAVLSATAGVVRP